MKSPKTSDVAVLKATGKNWKEWFNILDKAGAHKMPHKQIVEFVYSRYLGKAKKGDTNVVGNGWWSQMVTVEYERARGIREVNQKSDGFLVAVSKTLPGSVATLQKKWNEILKSKEVAKRKLQILPSKTKRAMIRYQADVGVVVVSFNEMPKGKAQIIVETVKLPKKLLVESTRAFWKKILTNF